VTTTTAPTAGAEFVARQRTLHVRRADGWCSCGFPHCGTRVLLDHLDHANALLGRVHAALLQGGQAHGDVRREALGLLQDIPVPVPRWKLRDAATTGGPCESCGRPRNVHVCISCADLDVGPDRIAPGPGCGSCRNTGMDQMPCLPPRRTP
jgi:hypothetical protein